MGLRRANTDATSSTRPPQNRSRLNIIHPAELSRPDLTALSPTYAPL